MTREEYLKTLDKLWVNGFYGKFVTIPNRAYMIMADRIVSIPDEDLYIDYTRAAS